MDDSSHQVMLDHAPCQACPVGLVNQFSSMCTIGLPSKVTFLSVATVRIVRYVQAAQKIEAKNRKDVIKPDLGTNSSRYSVTVVSKSSSTKSMEAA